MTAPPTTNARPADGGSSSERFEDLLQELESIVAQLDSGQLPLEESLQAFERGMAASRKAEAILAAAEARVEQLVRGPDGPQVVPFEPEGG